MVGKGRGDRIDVVAKQALRASASVCERVAGVATTSQRDVGKVKGFAGRRGVKVGPFPITFATPTRPPAAVVPAGQRAASDGTMWVGEG